MISKTTIAMLSVLTVGILATPFAFADMDAIKSLEAQLKEIEKKYDFPVQPELTDKQWNEYDTKVAAVENKLSKIYAEMDMLHAQRADIDKEYGFKPWPQHSEETWNQYNKEVEQVYLKLDEEYKNLSETHEGQYATEYQKILDDTGLPDYLAVDAPDSYYEKEEQLFIKYNTAISSIGDHTREAGAKQKAYAILVNEYIPEMRKLYKEYGLDHPEITLEQLQIFDEKLSELNKKYMMTG